MESIRWLNEYSRQFLEKDYLLPNQTVQDRIKVIGDAAESILGIQGYSQKLQEYISKGWISLSTPVWTNFGTERGLPISCFGSYIDDSVESILGSVAEIGTMSKYGGGTSGYFGALRGRGESIKNNGASNGSKSFLELFQSCAHSMNQGSVRRGYFSAYQDIDHPDFEEWLNIRGEGDPIQHITWGICVPTKWINEMKEGDAAKRKVWAKVIQKKFETGLPYIFYTDNANNHESTPEVYKGKNSIKASQMCTEIMLPSDNEHSFVCDLGSMNDFYFEEWKNTDCVEVLTFLLDAAMTEFIEKASKVKFLSRAVAFAQKHRALGVGRLGYHSLLQSKMIPFESLMARKINTDIQKNIETNSIAASKKLAEMFGECEMTIGTGRRNTTTQAIAPTTSSAFIMQVSQSIEPWLSNYMIKDLAKGKFVIKNKFLQMLLEEKGMNTDEVWDSIMKQQGSILHLDFLTDEEKLVFKTAREISQEEIIVQAAQRQKHIDQGQSLNLFITADTTAKEVNRLMILAHDMGVKSLYYQHSTSAASEFAKNFVACTSCE
jgi:ribonucleoside-diphosphate reductase alpha chain